MQKIRSSFSFRSEPAQDEKGVWAATHGIQKEEREEVTAPNTHRHHQGVKFLQPTMHNVVHMRNPEVRQNEMRTCNFLSHRNTVLGSL